MKTLNPSRSWTAAFIAAARAFDESKINRDGEGQFAPKGASKAKTTAVAKKNRATQAKKKASAPGRGKSTAASAPVLFAPKPDDHESAGIGYGATRGDVRKAAHSLTGKNFTTHVEALGAIKEMAGLPAGAKAEMILWGVSGKSRLPLDSLKTTKKKISGYAVNVFARNQGNIAFLDRLIESTPNGVVCTNEHLILNSTGGGAGTRIFAEQVSSLKRLGAIEMRATLSGDNYDASDGTIKRANGYYTWARLGYNADIPKSIQKKIAKDIGPKAKVATLHDLMATQKGRDAWRRHGVTVKGYFDLRKGSKSLRILEKYLAEKAKVKAAASATATTETYDLGMLGPSDIDDAILDKIWDNDSDAPISASWAEKYRQSF